jgi:hypothetical protein
VCCLLTLLLLVSCKTAPVQLELLELRQNPATGYYDAIVKVTGISTPKRKVSSFLLESRLRDGGPEAIGWKNRTIPCEQLAFIDAGDNEDRLEVGDVFVFPLEKPEFQLYAVLDGATVGYLSVWGELPEQDRWSPLDSAAMDMARTVKVREENGMMIPLPGELPAGWRRLDEEKAGAQAGSLHFVKKENGKIIDELIIRYKKLTVDELDALENTSRKDFLFDEAGRSLGHKASWARKIFRYETIAGHEAVVQGMNRLPLEYFPPIYQDRYLYIDEGVLIDILIRFQYGKPGR